MPESSTGPPSTPENRRPATRDNPDGAVTPTKNKITKRFGGRHFVYKVKYEGLPFVPHPYILISSIAGPIWAFYGFGQIWLTHKKIKEFDGWITRVSRFSQTRLVGLLNSLETPIAEFIKTCNENGIQGTIVIEQKLIEFHWTIGRHVQKPDRDDQRDELVESSFRKLVDAFAEAANLPAGAKA